MNNMNIATSTTMLNTLQNVLISENKQIYRFETPIH